MNREALEARRQKAEESFSSYTQQKQEIEAEMSRLQGEYRLIDDLLAKLEEEPVSNKPNKIDASKVKGV